MFAFCCALGVGVCAYMGCYLMVVLMLACGFDYGIYVGGALICGVVCVDLGFTVCTLFCLDLGGCSLLVCWYVCDFLWTGFVVCCFVGLIWG